MFSGLVEGQAEVVRLRRSGRGARLELARPRLARGSERWRPVRGESIAVSGCCLTVAALAAGGATSYDLSAETLALTHLGKLAPAQAIGEAHGALEVDR
ncbi:MAG: riboflavin synthase, partial [Planctomycetota bacterium]